MSGKARTTQEQASDWLVLLHDAPEDKQVQEGFEAWLDAEPQNALAWVDAIDAFDAIGAVGSEMEAHWGNANAAPVRQSKGIPPSRRGRGWVRRSLPSRRAQILGGPIAAALALWFAPAAMLHVRSDYTTAAGELRTLQLADGSVVRMGPGSAIAVDYGKDARRVRLLAGEAWFDVTHDPSAPFTVDAGEISTVVLGTSFDVRRSGGATAVSLKRGRVRVVNHGTASPSSRELMPGQWARVGADHAFEVGQGNPELFGAWQAGTLVARDRPIAEVIEELRPWYDGRILLLNSGLGDRRVDGVYNARKPRNALDALVSDAGGRVRQITPWLIIIS
ncbi:FecR family protein [Novosphingobium guangzhouense]|uniref:FecR family protein n=1 Tax=Novosphingobium guangzhouense TaxID=1850347 RepID=UPI0011AF65A7|nr:FecR domain-containing protein [Novosphingobium guangzhouense]